MFDDLLQPMRQQKRRRFEYHDALFGFYIAVFAGLGAFISVFLYLHGTTPVTTAQEPQVKIRLIDNNEIRYTPSPLTLYELVRAEVSVSHSPVKLTGVSFSLDGVYEIDSILHIYMFINESQAGDPVRPDEFGRVTFPVDSISLREGKHTVQFKITSSSLRENVLLRPVFQKNTSFDFADPVSAQFMRPFAASTVQIVSHGTVEAFVRDAEHAISQVYVYGVAEDSRASRLVFEADEDVSGQRIDLFYDGEYVTSAIFNGTSAVVEFDRPQIIKQGKNKKYTVLIAEPIDTTVRMIGVEATGAISKQTWTSELNVIVF